MAEVRLIYVCSIVVRQYLRSVTQRNEIKRGIDDDNTW